MPRILVVDDDITISRAVERLLRARGHVVTTAESGEAALSLVSTLRPDLILLDVQMPGMDGLTALERLGSKAPSVPVIITTALGDVDTAVSAFKKGAIDFVSKPFDEAKLLRAIEAATEPRRESEAASAPPMIGAAPRFRDAVDLALRFARPDINVLLHGETGTGKELFARCIHDASKRRGGPFVAVDCSMLAESLIESELFGHEKGAFTGAVGSRVGLFERAHGGTIFLDEIGNLSLAVQAKLLRVLQERTIERVGGRETRHLDIRVVSATNVDLREAAHKGTFRLDLYYRLAEATVSPPPLRERRADVGPLAAHFVARYAARYEAPARSVSDEALALLEHHDWPGNVRELENVIKFAVALAGERVEPAHLPTWIREAPTAREPQRSPARPASAETGDGELDEAAVSRSGIRFHMELELPAEEDGLDLKALASAATEKAERAILAQILREKRYSQAQLAKLMNVDPKTLRAKLRKYGLDASG